MKPTYEQLEQQLAAVVAENAGLKSAAKETLAHWAAAEPGEMELMMEKCMPALRDAYCETPATDAAIANIQAQGVEMFAHSMAQHLLVMEKNGEDAITKIQVGTASRLALAFAAQLRQGEKS